MPDLIKLMLVEDDPQVCESFRTVALRRPGLAVVYDTGSEREAFEYLQTHEVDVIILDVRTQEEYDSGHIKNAVCLPNEDILSEPDILPDKGQQILVYCRSGNRSKQAAQKLADMGYENVLEFGGILDWPYPELVE